MGAESTLTDELAAVEQQTFFDASGLGLQPPDREPVAVL
jgi:hypothetical protein